MFRFLQQLLQPVPTATVRASAPAARHKPHQGRPFFGADKVGLVGFHDYAFPISLPADPHAAWLHERVGKLPSKIGGSKTNLADGLRKSLDMLAKAPSGALKRIWLLTDGHPNREVEGITPQVRRAHEMWVNVNTIGFGDAGQFDEALLRGISSGTHNGRFLHVQSLRELSQALTSVTSGNHRRHRAEYTVLAIDCSVSMRGAMEGRTRIDVVRESVIHLLNWKQKVFA